MFSALVSDCQPSKTFFLLHYASVNSSCAQSPPPPPPRLLRDIYPLCQSRGWGICKSCAARGPGSCQPQVFDTHTVSYQNITTRRILLELYWKNNQIGPFVKDRKKLKTFVKAYVLDFMHAFLPLIKPELHSETRKLST